LPWIGILISAIIAIMFKDWATSLAKGLQFKWNPAFNEGDTIILDGQEGMIVKIGARETVFSVYSDSGLVWRYVPNERIAFLKLEKVMNPNLHLDTEEEKAKKLQSMIDMLQDEKIIENKKDIEQLKNGK
tara:strand:+ start:144 stop:533 length:390 start_codon:yes stop_codon:yes gene_type:complete